VARGLGPGHRVVTMLCDVAGRYSQKLYNPEFLRSKGLPAPPWLLASAPAAAAAAGSNLLRDNLAFRQLVDEALQQGGDK
jgi:hypothetical protein